MKSIYPTYMGPERTWEFWRNNMVVQP
jgi:hypothetical protein